MKRGGLATHMHVAPPAAAPPRRRSLANLQVLGGWGRGCGPVGACPTQLYSRSNFTIPLTLCHCDAGWCRLPVARAALSWQRRHRRQRRRRHPPGSSIAGVCQWCIGIRFLVSGPLWHITLHDWVGWQVYQMSAGVSPHTPLLADPCRWFAVAPASRPPTASQPPQLLQLCWDGSRASHMM